MKDIVILGSGGMGKEVAWLIENINAKTPTWNILGFLEEESKSQLFGQEIFGYKVLGGDTWILDYGKEVYVTSSFGKSALRKLVFEKVAKFSNVKFATLVDPNVRVDKSVVIGEGSIICRNCTLTVDTFIGKGVIMNTGSSVGHDSNVGNYCTFLTNSMAAGHTTFGECCEIGSGAFILQEKKVAAYTVLAPLSSVLKDITEPGIYSGNPARLMMKIT
jgi:sugar O-acyltransferase (sialic acid O-acetyltransferase NeuD family)